ADSELLGCTCNVDQGTEHHRVIDFKLEVIADGTERFHRQRLLGWSRRNLRTRKRCAAFLVEDINVVLDPRRLVVEADRESLGRWTHKTRRVEGCSGGGDIE